MIRGVCVCVSDSEHRVLYMLGKSSIRELQEDCYSLSFDFTLRQGSTKLLRQVSNVCFLS